ATFPIGADGETGDFKGLTLSQLKPRPPGLFFKSRPRRIGERRTMNTTRTHFTFRVAMLQPRPPKPPPPRPPKPPPPPPMYPPINCARGRGAGQRTETVLAFLANGPRPDSTCVERAEPRRSACLRRA